MNLFRKVIASVTLTALVISTGATSVSAYSNDDLTAANGLANAGVIKNNSANPANYNFAGTLTRAEAAKIAVNLDSEISANTTCANKFADVTATTPNTWVCGYVEALLGAGKISANAKYNPNSNLSKAEATKLMLEATGHTDIFSGASNWQAEVVAFAAENDIVSSFTDYNTPATRAFTFGVSYNAMNTDTTTDFTCDSTFAALGLCDIDVTTPTTKKPTTPVVVTPASNKGASVSLSPKTPVDGDVAANTSRTAVLVFDVTAGNEDLTLKQATLDYTWLSDSKDIDDVSIYIGNEKVSKTKSFSDNYLDLSFDKNIVINAGETKSLTVTVKIENSNGNDSHQITLSTLKTNWGNLIGTPIVGATLKPVNVTNRAMLEVKSDTASNTVTIGESVVLAGFELKETSDKENVLVKSITFHVNGWIDEDDLSNLVLTAEGVKISSDLKVNWDDEIIANLNYTIVADASVDFELEWVVTGSIGQNIHIEFESDDDIYAVGVNTGVNVSFATDKGANGSNVNIAESESIEWSEINISFEKSDIDEAKPDTEEVLVGNLKVTTTTDDYTITETRVQVTATGLPSGKTINDLIEKIELGGVADDNSSAENNSNTATSAVYRFDDIDLKSNEVLPLTFDIVDDAKFNGARLTFQIVIVEVEDDEENIKYTSGSTPSLDSILSTTALDNQTIDIESASFTLTNTSINDRLLVLGNGAETIVYKGKISVWDSDDVKIQDFDLVKNTPTHNITVNLNKVIDKATLNIGGQTFDAKIKANSVDFSSINAVIKAGTDNVEVLVTVKLKDNDSVTNHQKIALKLALTNNDLEDSNWDALNSANTDIALSTVNPVSTELLDRGTLAIKVINEADTDDNLENTVLAGESNVTIAEVEIEAEYENMKVKELSFLIAGVDHSNTLKSVKLVNTKNNKVIADWAVISNTTSGTIIKFKNDFIISDSDNRIRAELVATLNPITGEGDATSAVAGNLNVTAIAPSSSDVRGESSNDDITVSLTGTTTGETISIVPTKLKISVPQLLSNGSAKIKIIADSGNNTVGTSNERPEVTLTELRFAELGNNTNGYKIYKEGNASIQTAAVSASGWIVTFTKDIFSNAGTDVTFDNQQTYVIIPVWSVGQTYTLVLSWDVATYDVDTDPKTSGAITNLSSDISVGTKTY